MNFTTTVLPTEQAVPAYTLIARDIFHLAHVSLKDAVSTGQFFMRTEGTDKVHCLNLYTARLFMLPLSTMVIKRHATLNIDS